MLAVFRIIIRTKTASKGAISTVRNLLRRKENSELIMLASSLVIRRTSSVIQVMPRINLLTYLHKVYTQLRYFVNAIRYRLTHVGAEYSCDSRQGSELR